jgi:hypothetical protein
MISKETDICPFVVISFFQRKRSAKIKLHFPAKLTKSNLIKLHSNRFKGLKKKIRFRKFQTNSF